MFLTYALVFVGLVVTAKSVTIYPKSITKCPVSGKEVKFDMKLSPDHLDIDMDFPYDITEDFSINLVGDSWNPLLKKWKEDIGRTEGGLFEVINQYAEKIWEIMREASEPKIPAGTTVKAGTYKMRNVKIKTSDFKSPFLPLGKFRLKLKVLSPEDEEISCKVIEVELKP